MFDTIRRVMRDPSNLMPYLAVLAAVTVCALLTIMN